MRLYSSVLTFYRIDILFNIAGTGYSFVPLEEIEEQEWDKVYGVNVKGPFHAVKYTIGYNH